MSEALDQAGAKVDQCWADHEGARGPLRDELREILRSTEGVTGLTPGPGADNLIDRFLAFGEVHADDLGRSNVARAAALDAQRALDDVVAEEPFAEPDPTPGSFEEMPPERMRAWLRTANDQQVRESLSGVSTVDAQRDIAKKLLEWGRADGNQAQVFAAINEHLTPPNAALIDGGTPTGGTGATTTYEHAPKEVSADDEPASRDDAHEKAVAEADEPPSDDPDEILAWVGDDAARALQVHEAETQREDIRGDLLDALNAIIEGAGPLGDSGAPDPVGAPGPKPLYMHTGDDATINADAWTPAEVTTASGASLWTYFEDEPGGEPTGESDEWPVYDGPTEPVA